MYAQPQTRLKCRGLRVYFDPIHCLHFISQVGFVRMKDRQFWTSFLDRTICVANKSMELGLLEYVPEKTMRDSNIIIFNKQEKLFNCGNDLKRVLPRKRIQIISCGNRLC